VSRISSALTQSGCLQSARKHENSTFITNRLPHIAPLLAGPPCLSSLSPPSKMIPLPGLSRQQTTGILITLTFLLTLYFQKVLPTILGVAVGITTVKFYPIKSSAITELVISPIGIILVLCNWRRAACCAVGMIWALMFGSGLMEGIGG